MKVMLMVMERVMDRWMDGWMDGWLILCQCSSIVHPNSAVVNVVHWCYYWHTTRRLIVFRQYMFFLPGIIYNIDQ